MEKPASVVAYSVIDLASCLDKIYH